MRGTVAVSGTDVDADPESEYVVVRVGRAARVSVCEGVAPLCVPVSVSVCERVRRRGTVSVAVRVRTAAREYVAEPVVVGDGEDDSDAVRVGRSRSEPVTVTRADVDPVAVLLTDSETDAVRVRRRAAVVVGVVLALEDGVIDIVCVRDLAFGRVTDAVALAEIDCVGDALGETVKDALRVRFRGTVAVTGME